MKKKKLFSFIILLFVFTGAFGFLFLRYLPGDNGDKIARGVKLEDVALEDHLGRDPERENLARFIKNHARDLEREPKAAYIKSATKEAVPGVMGKELNLEKTIESIYNAPENEVVKLEFIEVRPEVTLNDLAPAPIYQGNPETNRVSFICNVAWGSEYIEDMLEVLDGYEVKISFILEGRWAKNHPQMVKELIDEGHEIGNHAYSHYNMSTLNRELIREEIEKTNETIDSIINNRTDLFGPPAGDYDDRVVEEADDLGMKTILWSLDTIDWMKPGKEYMVDKILNNIHGGAFILMHPTEDTVEAFEEILAGLKEEYYYVVPVSSQLEASLDES